VVIPAFISALQIEEKVTFSVSIKTIVPAHHPGVVTEPKNALIKQYQKMFHMEGGIDLEFREQALKAIARKALVRKTGARGLRSILEAALLDTMFDLPSLENVAKVVIDHSSVNGDIKPILIYSDKPKVAKSC